MLQTIEGWPDCRTAWIICSVISTHLSEEGRHHHDEERGVSWTTSCIWSTWMDWWLCPLWVPKTQLFTRPAEDAYPPLLCHNMARSSLASQLIPLHWMVHGLEWCHSHLETCYFQSALFITDSKSALAVFSTATAFLQPKSFMDIWDPSDSLSSRVAPTFHYISVILDSVLMSWQTYLLKLEHFSSPMYPIR